MRGGEQRDRCAQPGHERARMPQQLGQPLDWIQLRHGMHIPTSAAIGAIELLLPGLY